ncbi:uncharacterized protein [Aquarana catesbeiana]|uniref:uncharacterized protein isoform X3 n=1 Tax=Aquarana catesbeiana TaxID=8400 RepID=UPI003CCA67AF
MIDLSFLTEAEQEAILKVLNRDAELKKAEDERVKNLQDVVHDENEFKYKSGQWFYDAKSKRHREKIHGVDLVRASIRKRKKPATIELFGVMEAPDEAEEDIMVKKQEGNQSSKKVGFTSAEKEKDNLRNGTFSPPKARQNPFNSEGLDETDYKNEAPSLNPENVQMNGTEKPKSDIMSSLAKYGVKLPYPELSKSRLNTPKAQDGNNSQKEDMPIPVPKPRTFKVNGQPQDRSNSTLKRDDSLNGKEPLYAVVNKPSAAASPSQAQDFDMDDALMEPRFHGQRGKTQNIYLNEKPLEFGKSFSGGGKVTFESNYPSKKHKESCSLSSEEDLTPERDRISKTSPSSIVNKPVAITQDGDDPVESVALWRQPFKLKNQEPRLPSPELTEEQKSDVKAKDSFGKTYSENPPTSKTAFKENSKETEYKSIVLQNRYGAERKPLGLTANLVQNVSEPSKTSGQLDSLLHKNKGRQDLPRSLPFNVMSLKERINEMPREQMSNPSQFQSLKHFWNVEEKNLPRETTVTSPDKILMHVSSKNKPTRSDIRRRSSEIPADQVILPNTPDNLSEEEQTSQKVASWLAQTPTVYVDGQMDQNEDQLSSGKDIVEHVQKSAIPKKSDFTNTLQKGREEALEGPKITETEKSKTDEIQMVSQGDPDLGYRKQTTITFSPISQNYMERRAPTTDLKMTDRGFYSRVVQMSNKPSPAKETLSVEPKNKPYDEIMGKTVAPERSPRDSRIGFETLNNGISDKELSLPKEESETEEIIEKSAVPKSLDQQDFIFALKKLEIEASKQPPLPDFEVKGQGEIPKEEITQNTVTPVKSSFKMGFEHVSSANATNELEKSTDQVEEIIEKSAVPKSRDQQDFIFALKKLEIEASKQPPLPDFEMKGQGEIPKEEITQNTVTPVKSSFKMGFEHVSSANATNELEKSTDQVEEIIEKSAVPKSRDQQDFIFALKKLEIEASKQPPLPDFEMKDQGEIPKEEITQNTVTPVKSSFKIGFEHSSSTNDDAFETPTDHSVKFQPQRSYASSKESSTEVPSYMEETIEKSTVPSKKDNEDLSIALRKLELEAIEHQSDEYVAGVNQGVEFEKPESKLALQTNSGNHSDINYPYLSNDGKSVDDLEQPPKVSSYGLKWMSPTRLDTFDGQGKLSVSEEQPIEKNLVESQSSVDFHSRLMRLEEQAKIPEDPEDLLDDTVKVSQFPNREVVISKRVYSSIESMPSIENFSGSGKAKEVYSSWNTPQGIHDPKSHDYSHYEELANYPHSPELSGSYTGNGNLPYKKPEVGSPEVSNSKPGMDESNPILRALKRSEAKMLNFKAVQEVSPTSTNQLNSSSPTEDIPVNSFPQNPEKLKRLSQSVPAFINDDTDGRDTDSASESSFQIGRHKKSPSSLTNLSGSSGMASMSSVSGSVMSIYSGDFGNVDIKGGIEFSIDYVEQLKEFLIYIYQCRELAVAEAKKQRSDPYVKAYLLPEKAKMGKRKTAVKKKTLDPVYNEILRYKISKQSLLAQTLNLSVWHHDALGRNSFLGEVNVNLGTWDWSDTQRKWYQLEPRTPAAGIGLENRGEMKLALKYVPMSSSGPGTKPNLTGEVHISIKDCLQLPMLRGNKINSFVKCTVLPDTSRKSRQRTRTVDKTPNPYFNHTMVYDGFKEEDLREACVELTVWDHNRLSNHFLGGLRIGLGTGKSYGTPVDWMDSTHEEVTMWEKMMASPDTWIEGMLPLRMFKMAKLAK